MEEFDDLVAMSLSTEKIKAIFKAMEVDVSEIYSPPRVCEEAKKFGLKVGESMDCLLYTSDAADE